MEERFIDIFSLGFFATENWEYDYKDNPSEFQFRSWQETQTNIAKTKQDMLLSFIRSEISTALNQQREMWREAVEKLRRDELGQAVANSEGAFVPTDVDIAEEESYNKAITDVINLLDSKEKEDGK